MHQIYNFYEQLRGDLTFNKFEVKDLLFVEYNCPLDVESVKIWSKSDYIIYVLSGRKTWQTMHHSWTVRAGEALYIKKGANILHQHLEENFCMLGFFISDDIIQATVEELRGKVAIPNRADSMEEAIFPLTSIPNLDSFYQSMLSYFRYSQAPMSSILELKAKELLMNIIHAGNHPELLAYYNAIATNKEPSLPRIMEDNFSYNLKLSEFAALSNRSLSSFKRDFKAHFGTTPGKWLLEKRLEHAARLLLSGSAPVSEIAFESGFEDLSHFSKSFKDKFGKPPNNFRKQA